MVQKRDINPYSSEVTMPLDIPAPIIQPFEPIEEEVMSVDSMDKQMEFHKEMMAEMLPSIEENTVQELDIKTDDMVEDTISEPEHIEEVEEVEEVEVEEVEVDSDDESEDSEIIFDEDIEDDEETAEDFKGLMSDDESEEVEVEDLPDNWDDIKEAAQEILDSRQ